jgi:hypothetical protein
LRSGGSKGGAFHIHIDFHIGMRGVDAGVAEPGTYDIKFDAALEQMERCSVPEGVRANDLASEVGIRRSRETHASPYDEMQAKPSKRSTCGIEKKGLVRFLISLTVPQHVSQALNSLGPQGAKTLLATLAQQSHLSRGTKANCGYVYVDYLLRSRSCVVEKPEEGSVSASLGLRAIGSVQEITDLLPGQTREGGLRPPLKGNAQDALAESGDCWLLGSHVAEKAVDCGKPGITCSNSIAAGGLKVFEKGQHCCRIQAGEFESRHAAASTFGCEPQQ